MSRAEEEKGEGTEKTKKKKVNGSFEGEAIAISIADEEKKTLSCSKN